MDNPSLSIDEEVNSNKTNGFKPREEDVKNDIDDILYGIHDVPPWYIAFSLGIQHNLEMITCAVAVPFILTPALCMVNDDPDKAIIISSLIFMSGIITVLQSTVGNTLPIVQGGSFSYLVPSLAILSLPRWKCPDNIEALSPQERTEEWQVRMREIQGAIICAAMVELLLGLTGCIGFLTRYVTPITVAPAITMIGLSLFKNVMGQCSKNYYVAFSMTILLIIFSQHLRNVKVSFPGNKSKFPIFQVLPVSN